jgi:hypothetical protein
MYDKKVVENKLYNGFLAWPQQYVTYPDKGKAVVDEKGFQSFLDMVSNSSYEKKAEIISKAHLTIYFNTKNWTGYVQTVNGMLSDKIVTLSAKDAEQLYSYAEMIHRFGPTDKKAVQEATNWASQLSTLPGVSVINKASYQELYAALLEDNGQQALAKEVRKNINQQQLTEAQNGSPMKQMRIIPKQPS